MKPHTYPCIHTQVCTDTYVAMIIKEKEAISLRVREDVGRSQGRVARRDCVEGREGKCDRNLLQVKTLKKRKKNFLKMCVRVEHKPSTQIDVCEF